MSGNFLLNPSLLKQEIAEFKGIANGFVEDHPYGGSPFDPLMYHLDDLHVTQGVVESSPLAPIQTTICSIANDKFRCRVKLGFHLKLSSNNRRVYTGPLRIENGSSTHVEVEALDPTDEGKIVSTTRYHFDIANPGQRGFATHFQQSEFNAKGNSVRCSIPRVPTFVYHPLDVFDFMLGEIFEEPYLSQRSSRGNGTRFAKAQADRLTQWATGLTQSMPTSLSALALNFPPNDFQL